MYLHIESLLIIILVRAIWHSINYATGTDSLLGNIA